MSSQQTDTPSVFGPSFFIRSFLSSRGLESPTGGALYSYHPNREEFYRLQKSLLEDAERLRLKGEACVPSLYIAHAFVLYLSMKVAFEYEEGRVSWSELLKDLNYDYLGQSAIAELLERGARFWKTEHFFTSEGHYNIGFVFSQAGIPIKALCNQAGWGSSLLFKTYHWQARNGHPEEAIVRRFLEGVIAQPNNSYNIPFGVNDQLAIDLIAKSVVALRDTLDRVSHLPNNNELNPQDFIAFKTHFPACALSKEEFTRFICDIRQALSYENQCGSTTRAIHVERNLRKKSDRFEFALIIKILKPKMTSDEFKAAFGFDLQTTLPKRGLLMFNQKHIGMFTVYGNEVSIRFNKSAETKFHEVEALKGVVAAYKPMQPNGPVIKSVTTIANAEPLTLTEPLIFVEHHDSKDIWDLRKTGSCSLAGSRVLIWVSDEASIVNADESSYHVCHHDGLTKSNLIEVSDSVEVEIEGDRYRVRLKEVDTNEVQYEIRGNLWCTTVDGLPVYRGKPRVLWFDETQVSEREAKNAEWQTDTGVVDIGAVSSVGVYVCRVRNDSGELLRRIRMVILPDYANESMTIAPNRGTGQWILNHWGIENCSVSDIDVTVDMSSPSVLKLECPERHSVNESLQFEVTLRGTQHVSPVRLMFEYPQELVAFVNRSTLKTIKNEYEITLSEARDLQVIVKVPDSKVNLPVFMTIEPGDLGVLPVYESMSPSLFKTTVQVPIDKATHVGFLNFEDFAPFLYRAMRVCQGAQIEQYVRLGIETCSGSHKRLLVAKVTGCLQLNSRVNEVTLIAKRQIGMALVGIPLFTCDASIELGDGDIFNPIKLPRKITESDEPWLILQKDDPKYQTLPLIYSPANFGISMEMPTFCQIRGLWLHSNGSSDAMYRQMEGAVIDMLHQPLKYEKDWDFIHQQLNRFGTRGFANLPYWCALRNNVPLAFVFAVVLGVMHEPKAGERSLLWCIARVQSWRWELISFMNQRPNPVQQIHTTLIGLGLDDSEHRWADFLLNDESIRASRAMTHKLTMSLMQLGLVKLKPELLRGLRQELDWPLIQSKTICLSIVAEAWNDMMQRHQIGFAGDSNDDYFKDTRLMIDGERSILKYMDTLPNKDGLQAELFKVLERLRIYSRHTKEQGFSRVIACHLPLVLPILIAFSWERSANTGYGVQSQKLLARKGIYYLTETLLMRDPDITADAFAMVALLEKHLKDLKGRG